MSSFWEEFGKLCERRKLKVNVGKSQVLKNLLGVGAMRRIKKRNISGKCENKPLSWKERIGVPRGSSVIRREWTKRGF